MAAASNEREDVRVELSQADSDLLSETINSTLLAWFCDYNGLTPCGVFRVIKKAEDLKAASETDKNVAAMGFKMTLAGVQAKYGEHWEEAPIPETAKTDIVPGTSSFAESGEATPEDPTQAITDALVTDTAAAWTAMADQLQALVDQAASGADLQKTIAQAYGDMESDQLVKLMAAAMALVELKGIDAARAEVAGV